jgi:hypothetical protein
MNARNGKIARLPVCVRDELNERLERSEPGPQLLAWLNRLKPVREVVQKDFAGAPISPQNLSQWRRGGFQEWLARRDFCEEIREVGQLADKITDEYASGVLADDAATVLAGRFAVFIGRWNGDVDEQFETRARVLNGLCRSVVQLQRGMHRAKRQSFELEHLLEEKEKREQEEVKKKLVAPLIDMLKVDPLAEAFGGGTIGRKIAKYILAVRRDRPAELNILPTDKFEEAEPEPKEPEPVNPARKQRTMKRTRKARARKMYKPLQENVMAVPKQEKPGQDQLKSIKVNQSDLAQAKDSGSIGPISPIPPISPISPQEDSEATELQQVKKLAEKGDAYGEYCLGTRYRDGFGVPKDLAKAREWLGKAASQGFGNAVRELHVLGLRFGD